MTNEPTTSAPIAYTEDHSFAAGKAVPACEMDRDKNETIERDQVDRRVTAYHEAAHAVMCIWKGVVVGEVVLFEVPTEDGTLGHCRHVKADNWLDSIRIGLAGPVMDAIQRKRPFYLHDAPGCSHDINKAWNTCLAALAPRPPVELQEWLPAEIGPDLSLFVDAYAIDGWRPSGLSAQLKRKMTMYCKRYEDAQDFVQELIHKEAQATFRFMQEAPGFMKCVTAIAERLLEKSKLTVEEIYETCRVAAA